jgi:uncharacterized membrane protein YkvA (DUF1232 family)
MSKINPNKFAQRLRGFGALWTRRTEVVGMLSDSYNKRYRMTLFTQIALLLSLLYVISPFDFIPDWIPFLGWSDDVAMLYFLTGRILAEVTRWQKQRLRPIKVYSDN